jgi:DNA-binding response OmpR family regulator
MTGGRPIDQNQNRILLVAGDPDIGELYTMMLARAIEARTTWVHTIRTARTLIAKEQAFHTIVVDIMMPSDWDECEVLAREERAPGIVAITGWIAADGRFRRRAFEAGCAAFLAKPCEPKVLVEAVRRVQRGERNLVFVSDPPGLQRI